MIESIEDAKKYVNKVILKLEDLNRISEEAGLRRHRALWLCLQSVMLDDPEEIEVFIGICGIYMNYRLKRSFSKRR